MHIYIIRTFNYFAKARNRFKVSAAKELANFSYFLLTKSRQKRKLNELATWHELRVQTYLLKTRPIGLESIRKSFNDEMCCLEFDLAVFHASEMVAVTLFVGYIPQEKSPPPLNPCAPCLQCSIRL